MAPPRPWQHRPRAEPLTVQVVGDRCSREYAVREDDYADQVEVVVEEQGAPGGLAREESVPGPSDSASTTVVVEAVVMHDHHKFRQHRRSQCG